ncbi:hypothetical protein IE53DRAFT_312161 [Violaceomyces palustris]|uniref:Uncharacterized protein n=1 Tax=Violaceomyces palustris TaxID=1673888 RepID=A0ACD0P337_9BASI|nr:hypothetical protein IE53DRAFT_312161 [Violaceomyces palustris]
MRRSLIQDLVSQTSYSDKDKSRSRIWSPIRLTECIENVTQPYYAPCQAEVVNQRFGGERVLYAEELIYPDFAIREPIYPKGDSGTSTRRRWKEIMSREGRGLARGVDGVDWWQYNGERGQNFLLANVSYQGPSFDSWSSEACMGNEAAIGYLKSHHDEQAFGPISEGGDPNILDLALLANSPDSWSFQHFLDRGTHEIAQGLPLALASRRSFEKWVDGANPTEPRLVIGKGANKEVNDLRRMMLGDKLDQATVHGDSNLRARWLVDPCRTPLIHPWLSLKALERIQVPTSKARPMSERKVVIYAGRGDGSATNGGRNVVNEEELVSAMEGLLERRGQGEKLVKFTKNMFANLTETMDYFASNVRAIVGPHGGALMNSRWVPPGSLLVEMMPTSFTSIAIYEEASVLGLHYASIIVEPTGKNDLTIDPNDVVGILEDHLGRQGEEPPVKHNYMWRSKELDVQGVDLQSWKESQAEGAIRGMRRVVKREGGGLSRGER